MITVLTSITGGKDHVINGHVHGTAKFVAYLDAPEECEWEVRPAYNRFTSLRRNSRVPKMLAHQFADTKYSLWLDGNIRLLKSPDELVETYLKDHDIAVFKHPTRDCIYDEATVCAKRGLNDVETIIAQAVAYEKAGYAKHR